MTVNKPTNRAPSKAQTKPKAAQKRREPVAGAGNGGVVPPVEYRFKPGNRAGVGHGRPRKLKDLQELIIETLAEETGNMTRAQLMVRTMLIKSPSDRKTLLEYVFGKVPDVVREHTWQDTVIELLVSGKITEEIVIKEVPEYAQTIIAAARVLHLEGGATDGAGNGE
jgi:hypothetical protein